MAMLLSAGFASQAHAVVVGDSAGGGDSTTFGVTAPDGQASTTTMCSGIYAAGITAISGDVATIGTTDVPSAAQEANEFQINELAFRNISTWKLAEEVSFNATTGAVDTMSDDNGLGLEIARSNGTAITGASYPVNGIWSVTSFIDAAKVAIVLMTEFDEWGIYLVDMTNLTGAWDFDTTFTETAEGKAPSLKSFQIYVASEVPVPAALPLMLTGIAGLVAIRRRKRAA